MKYEEIAKQKFSALCGKKVVRILAIESSCDETSIAIVENGRKVLANVIATQIEIHRRFGGVVPEVASRNHIACISSLLEECMKSANLNYCDIDAVAVTYGAGLVGALLVGVNFAKSLAYSLSLPLIAVSHITGHISANYISHKDLTPPFACLMVSGGHTALLDVQDYTKFNVVGTTLDDAAGEAFDKVARVLGLPYPGGPAIDKLAKEGYNNIELMKHSSLKNTFDFSFSGIKTAVVNYVHNSLSAGREINKANVACSFEEYVTEELSSKALLLAQKLGRNKLVVAGGVGANSRLRELLQEKSKEAKIDCYFPVLEYCTDNGAMIGSSAYYLSQAGKGLANLSLTAMSRVSLNGEEKNG